MVAEASMIDPIADLFKEHGFNPPESIQPFMDSYSIYFEGRGQHGYKPQNFIQWLTEYLTNLKQERKENA